MREMPGVASSIARTMLGGGLARAENPDVFTKDWGFYQEVHVFSYCFLWNIKFHIPTMEYLWNIYGISISGIETE